MDAHFVKEKNVKDFLPHRHIKLDRKSDRPVLNIHQSSSDIYAEIIGTKDKQARFIDCDSSTEFKSTELGEFFMCLICEETVACSMRVDHESSTVHIFNLKLSSNKKRKVHLDETNAGFRLLTKLGWNVDTGLGPLGTGRIEPIGTMFKTDTSGLGAAKLPRRITHIPSHSETQARADSKGKSEAVKLHEALTMKKRNTASIISSPWLSGAELKRQQHRENKKVKAIRWELGNRDAPEGYETYFT